MAKARDIPGLRPDMTFADAARATVRVRAQELFDHEEGVLDTQDIERVHAMRVATRRLRAALEFYAPCFPRKRHRRALREVKRLADALGERRDPDVQLAGLDELHATLDATDRPGLELLRARLLLDQAGGNVTLAAALRHAEATGLRRRLARLTGDAA